jgi:FkbM family methyltransferase
MISRELIYPTPNWPSLVLKSKPVILDIGANDGGTSKVFQHLFPEGFVYAFEPDPRAILHCKHRLISGDIDGARFELFEGAVCDICGEAEFFLSDGVDPNFKWYESGYDLSGSLLKPISETPFGIPTIYFRDKIQVKTITLDSWAKDKPLEFVDILWMDVQGAEARVLAGAKETIKKVDFIYLECEEKKTYESQPDLQDIRSMLSEFDLLISYDDGNHLFKRISS